MKCKCLRINTSKPRKMKEKNKIKTLPFQSEPFHFNLPAENILS